MMLGPSVPDPTIDLRGLIISKQADVSNPTQQGRYERNWNTLYVGGLPLEWGEDQVRKHDIAGAVCMCSITAVHLAFHESLIGTGAAILPQTYLALLYSARCSLNDQMQSPVQCALKRSMLQHHLRS